MQGASATESRLDGAVTLSGHIEETSGSVNPQPCTAYHNPRLLSQVVNRDIQPPLPDVARNGTRRSSRR